MTFGDDPDKAKKPKGKDQSEPESKKAGKAQKSASKDKKKLSDKNVIAEKPEEGQSSSDQVKS